MSSVPVVSQTLLIGAGPGELQLGSVLSRRASDVLFWNRMARWRLRGIVVMTACISILSRVAAWVYNDNGMPIPSRYETKMPGLYFGGYYVAPIDMLHKIGIVAKRISKAIAAKNVP